MDTTGTRTTGLAAQRGPAESVDTTRPVTSRLSVAADLLSVREVGPWLRDLLAATGADEGARLLARLELAVHEVCTNAVDHADLAPTDRIRLVGRVHPHRVVVAVSDEGRPFDGADAPEPVAGVAQVRGYGLMIVRQLVDEVAYRRTGTWNTWLLTLHR
ncbi:ATP-binding protein [Nakamurella endophytica]|uniref:Histidine kinase/HSP90-like ATPase domain-containing protein n=1 Tax=Nakamurella endophytica TaxID=1748367 RepID=A0A917SWW0_9ACTN|nr:ATP-binding protein [Nakamurella endophytica]GGM00685.1 hypothetical protein GCM10011594_20980 [Nakamurella endophytica]